MRRTSSILCLVIMLAVAAPTNAQHRTPNAAQQSAVRLFDQGQTGLSLNSLFSPEHFRMNHSFEMTASSFGGGSSLAMYTNSLNWQFNSKLAARMDISMAYDALASQRETSLTGQQNGRIFLRNAEIAYRPSERTLIHLSVRQSPYGNYMNPYGYGGAGYRDAARFDQFGMQSSMDRLFWQGN